MKKQKYRILYKITTIITGLAIIATFLWLAGLIGRFETNGEITKIANVDVVITVVSLVIETLLLNYLLHIICSLLSFACVVRLWIVSHRFKKFDQYDDLLLDWYALCDLSYRKLYLFLFRISLAGAKEVVE